MTSTKKNGYLRVPTFDPDEVAQTDMSIKSARKKKPPEPLDLKPGLFVMFSKDRQKLPSESEEIEMTNLKPKRTKHRRLKSPKSPSSKKSRQELIEEPLLPGDTIQRVALRYACPVSELRRINKLYSDQDFHALKTIKIPVKEYSLLTDAKEREKRRNLIAEPTEDINKSSSGGNSADDRHFGGPESYYTSDVSQDADDECGGEDSDTPEYRDISIQSALKWKHSRQTLLNKLDEDLQRVKDSNESQSNVREVRLTLDVPSIHPVTVQEYTKSLLDIDWRILIFIVIGVILLITIGLVVLCAIIGHCPVGV